MAARDVLKNLNLFVDGRGYAGQLDEYNPPDLTLSTEDYRGGGMDAPVAIEMGQEPLETSFALIAYDADALSTWGVAEGSSVPLTVRGALESYDGTVKPVVHRMRGKITSISRGTWAPGQKPTLTITMRPDYYQEVHNGTILHEIDVENMIRVVNGVDRLAAQRAALGL
ncbi:phage major tail tube protein [Roseovarius pacificus]|uniref:phage major tail tube protein n=1 Tax=Roseovarius pacificus TaxID=337701 RepID=UPI002A1872BF|nr:phage major tail tube protein [Roseovarius pacificus]